NSEPGVMEAKPKLYYFRGRGRMESIRWLLAAAGVEFEEEFLETREQYEKLQKDGCLLFDQVPLVEIDGMLLTQSRAILSYLAAKYNLYGKDLKERVRIDMYADGTLDLMIMIAGVPFKPPEEKEENYALIVKRAKTRYFPVFEKILKDHGEAFLVGNQLSWADIQLLEAILMVEELSPPMLSDFPLLQAFKTRISNIPTIKKFLQPGSQRKPPPDDHYVKVDPTVLSKSWPGRGIIGTFFYLKPEWCKVLDLGIKEDLRETTVTAMSGKPVLHYFNGRGRMECIRWLLAAAGVEFEEKFIERPEDLEKLKKDGKLMFEQVPMVEIDGMTLVQTRAILNYIATKYDLYGKDMKERALIDIYTEGIVDLTEMIMQLVLCPPDQKEAKISMIKDRTKNRYLPAFEKVLKSHGQDYLVGNRLTRVDIHLLELLLYVEEFDSSLLAPFPLLK
ncbi:hypothetical protein STEG23_007284, partial [Scotinomys teguina]